MARQRAARLLWPALVLVATLLVLRHSSEDFLHYADGRFLGSLVDVFNRGARVMLLALGMTLVIATGGVDLSVGAVMAIAGAVAAALIKHHQAPLPLVLLAALASGALCGLCNGLLVARLDIQPIIATLVLMVAGRGVAQLITDGQILTFTNRPFEYLGTGYLLAVPFPVILVLMMLAASAALVDLSAVRLCIESVGNNPTASRCAGVPVARVKLLVYVLSGLCAALAGMVETADIRGADANNAGLYLELDAILAVVIGGTALSGGRFSLVGALVGALIVQALTTTILTSAHISVNATRVVKALVVVVVCLLQSDVFRAKVGKLLRGGR
jgi:simple sugar transport system permease protein